jgi:Superinfection immunity protein
MPLIVAVTVVLIAVAYMAPSLIAYARAVPQTRAIVSVNVRWGWTGIRWAQALRMALARPPALNLAPASPAAATSWQAQVGPGRLDPPGRAGAAPPLLSQARGTWPGDPAQSPGWWPPPGPAAGPTGELQRYPGPAPLNVPVRQPNGPAVAAMVLGILAMVLEWFGLITLALAIAAIVFGAVGVNRSAAIGTGRGRGIAGIILGGAGLAAYIFWGAISLGLLWLI